MTIITRRAALGGLALLSGSASTLANTAPGAPPVDAELLRIGEDLKLAETVFFEAVEAEDHAYRRWHEIRPQPDAIILAPRDFRLRMVDYALVQDPRGKLVPRDEYQSMAIAEPASIRAVLASYDGRGTTARWLRRMLAHAEQFSRDLEIADEQSGASAAGVALRQAWYEILRLSNAAFEEPASSLPGLAVLVRSAVLADLGRSTCMSIVGDSRFAKLAGSINAMMGERS